MAPRIVGTSVPRVDGWAKVTGTAQYAVDASVPGMVHGVAVRSARAHAEISSIDASDALSIDGVLAVITADDLSDLFPYYGHIITDHPVMAIERTRFMGEPVALVVGESRRIAEAAARIVDVSYRELDWATTIEAALHEDAVPLHDVMYQQGGGVFWETVPKETPGNIAHTASLEWGDLEGVWEEAYLVVETEARYPMLYAYAMEPYCAVATHRAGGLDVISSTQHPFMVRQELARMFGLDLTRVRVAAPYVGGGYGSKSWTKVEPLAAIGAWKTGRPVKVALTVEEAMLTTRADGAIVKARSAFTQSGRILARQFDLSFNTGAYADSSPSILDKAVHRCFGPYQIPNLAIDARLVYTNTVPASSYRGFGAPQTNAAGEYNMDRAATELGIDPAELRRRNLLHAGAVVLPGRRPLDADLPADLELLVDGLADVHSTATLQGVGFGCSVSDAGAYPTSMAMVRVLPDGSAVVSTGAVEIGQGSATAISQIAAEELGLPTERVTIIQSDTASTLLERTTNASRTTTLVGLAVQRACQQAIDRLRELAAQNWGVDVEHVTARPGILQDAHGRSATVSEVIDEWFGLRAGEAIGIGIVRREGEAEAMPPFWEVGMSGVAIAIDEETFEVEVSRLVTVGDVGFAVNPKATEGQDLGAATQGLGGALYEELVYDEGQLINPNVVDYRIPRFTDLAKNVRSILAQREDGIGPYGAKGGGEGALNPIGAAVASAVSRALDEWLDVVELPLTPERIWRMAQRARGDA